MRVTRTAFCGLKSLVLLLAFATAAAGQDFHRLYDGITLFVDNPEGRAFDLSLDVIDINIYETGPREVLVKVYDPAGQTLCREVIPDDGVTSQAFLPPMGGWDHEAWYYAHLYMLGTQPMWKWSAPSQPDRLQAAPKHTVKKSIAAGKGGVWRVLIVGATDHYVRVTLDPQLKYGVSGHPDWLHGHGTMFSKGHLYVPKGALGVHLMLAEFDVPRTRRVTLRAPNGAVLGELAAPGAAASQYIKLAKPGQFDDQVLTLDVSAGKGDFMHNVKFQFPKDPEVTQRGTRVIPAVFAPDAATAKALRGGAIYHDSRVFWQPYQVKLHDWLKGLAEDQFVVKDADGQVVDAVPSKGRKSGTLPFREGFIRLNGPYWGPPLSDRIMFHWIAHKNRAALNVAIRDLAAGLRSIGPNDHVAVASAGPYGNMGYEFSNYAWHYWRPAWRVLQESDAPGEVKQILRDAFLVCGDRLAFCRSWARVNGNSYAQVLSALRYCYAATGDKLQRQLFDTYWQRFVCGGWGKRVGVGSSGPVQEGFAYAYHYASYILTTWQSVIGDFHDPRFQQVHDRIRTWFSYTLADGEIAAGPWSSRTHFYPHWSIEKDGRFAWKGLPGPDFTVSVHDANEWFAARRANYYVLTYHGRLSPKWESNAHAGQAGYGGGMLCQLHVPGRGPVLAATLNDSYGAKMHPSQWRGFHIHSVVGQTVEGQPLVAGDSEHLDAKLDGQQVTSSGDVRQSAVRSTRSYTFERAGIRCTLQLGESPFNDLLNLWVQNPRRGQLALAYEMIPFVPMQARQPGKPKQGPTVVTLADAAGKDLGPLGTGPTLCKTVTIDRGGFGVRIELDKPRRVLRGENNTVLIELIEKPTAASGVSIGYRLVPFNNS